jgi:hypothetical protein
VGRDDPQAKKEAITLADTHRTHRGKAVRKRWEELAVRPSLPDGKTTGWLRTTDGRGWLWTTDGREWLWSIEGWEWLRGPGGAEWLELYDGRTWLWSIGGGAWLRSEDGRMWLRSEDGWRWLSSPKEGGRWFRGGAGWELLSSLPDDEAHALLDIFISMPVMPNDVAPPVALRPRKGRSKT